MPNPPPPPSTSPEEAARAAEEAAVYDHVKQDQRALIESCFSIIDGDTQQKVPFLLREPQAHYWDNRTLCDAILKSRKIGFSALIDAEFLTDAITKENCRIVVVGHRDEDVAVHLKRVVWMKDQLPFDVPVKTQNDGGLEFTTTGSTMEFVSALSREPRRGADTTHLKLTERAFYQSETFLAAVEGSCVKNARRVIETTANGAGTAFHKFWLRTKRGETAYKAHFYAWWRDPRNQLAGTLKDLGDLDEAEQQLVAAYQLKPEQLLWRRHAIRNMSNPDLFDQENPHSDEAAFLVSGRMVFDWLAIQRMAQAAARPLWRGRLAQRATQGVEFVPVQEGPLTVWVAPKEHARYLVAADVAEGLPDGAWSVADVLDTATGEQVAQWRGRVNPMTFADVLGDLGAYYNWALVAPEVNNHGLATCARLQDQGYPKLYSRTNDAGTRTDLGWLTTTKTKYTMINGLNNTLRTLGVKVNSPATLEDLKSFVYLRPEDGLGGTAARESMGPQKGAYADCVMSLAIGVALLGERRESPEATRRRFREAMGVAPRPGGARLQKKGGPGYGVRRF